MAKYSGAKQGAKYSPEKAGKRDSIYLGDKSSSRFLGTGTGIYDPSKIMGTDGASLLGGYDVGKGMMDALLKGYGGTASGYMPGHGVDPLNTGDRKYETKKESKGDNDKPCLLCGAPAIDGSPFCLVCISKN